MPAAGCVDIDPHTPCMHNRSIRLFGGTVRTHHAIRVSHTEIRCSSSGTNTQHAFAAYARSLRRSERRPFLPDGRGRRVRVPLLQEWGSSEPDCRRATSRASRSREGWVEKPRSRSAPPPVEGCAFFEVARPTSVPCQERRVRGEVTQPGTLGCRWW